MATAVEDALLTSLRDIYLFRELSDKHLKRVASLGKVVTHQAGHEVADQGQMGLWFHLVLDGKADVAVNGATRRTLGPGDYFGEIAVIDQKPRSATVVATTSLQTWALQGIAFRELLEAEPTVCRAVLVGLCARIRELEKLPQQRGATD